MTFNSAPFDDIKMALNGTFEKTTTLAVKLHGLVPTIYHSATGWSICGTKE